MTNLEKIVEKYQLDISGKPHFEIPGSRYHVFPELINQLGFEKGVEIGTERGLYAKGIARRCPTFKLYCVDPWKAYSDYKEHISQEKLDRFYQETKERIAPYNVELIRGFSEDAHKLFNDNSIDFLYLDGNHEFTHIVDDLKYWSPKVRSGGIIAGHDFRRNSAKYINDTKDVINGYTFAKKINPWFVVREEERASSWFWVV